MTDKINVLRMVDEIIALDEKATAGPWQSYECGVHYGKHKHGVREHMLCETAGETFTPQQAADARFIAHTRTSAPAFARAMRDFTAYLKTYVFHGPTCSCVQCVEGRALLARLGGDR